MTIFLTYLSSYKLGEIGNFIVYFYCSQYKILLTFCHSTWILQLPAVGHVTKDTPVRLQAPNCVTTITDSQTR